MDDASKSNQPSSAASAPSESQSSIYLKRNSEDIGWEYGELRDPNNKNAIKCKLCKHEHQGGIYRQKLHIAGIKGQVKACPRATEEDKQRCRDALANVKKAKTRKMVEETEERNSVHIVDDDNVVEIGSKLPRQQGPMDQFATKINPTVSLRQQTVHEAINKEKTEAVHQYLARWVYEAGIPFNAIQNRSFMLFCEAVGQYGPGYHPPSQYQLSEPLLKKEVETMKKRLKQHEEEWGKTGCSIMTDAWTDRKRRSIMNLCVNSRLGTTFLSSKEDFEEAHTGAYIAEYVEKQIVLVGEEKVVQVVTDNASNNMAAADIILAKRPRLFWTCCATHTLNLILEGIGKIDKFKNCINKAKNLTVFIYAHHRTLAMMRKFTQKRDIVRRGVTRLATSYLTLQSLMEKKHLLRAMFTSKNWTSLKSLANSKKGKEAYATVMSIAFWRNVSMCIKVFTPLVKVLRLVDGDKRPSMGFVVGELEEAKLEIHSIFSQSQNGEALYKPIADIIDKKSKGRLDTPLHLAAYFLNPYYYYKDTTKFLRADIMKGLTLCVEKFFDDPVVMCTVLNEELLQYKNGFGMFGSLMAKAGREHNNDKFDPVGWWSNWGLETPNLCQMAMRILSLTSSASGCERAWSTFEGVHTKKRNRLEATRMNNLVYVQFNSKLFNKKEREKEHGGDVLLASDASKAQGWLVEIEDEEDEVEEVEGGDGLTWNVIAEATGADEILAPRRSTRIARETPIIRELNEELEDSSSSDDLEDMHEDVGFIDSDEDRIIDVDKEIIQEEDEW